MSFGHNVEITEKIFYYKAKLREAEEMDWLLELLVAVLVIGITLFAVFALKDFFDLCIRKVFGK